MLRVGVVVKSQSWAPRGIRRAVLFAAVEPSSRLATAPTNCPKNGKVRQSHTTRQAAARPKPSIKMCGIAAVLLHNYKTQGVLKSPIRAAAR